MIMSKTNYLSQLLKSKIPDSTEIEIHFFELCNLRCQFCGQDHNAKSGLDTIVEKAEPVIEFISTNSIRSHILNLMGGELFNDELKDSVFEDYYQFAIRIHQFAESIGHHIHINWVTNLIFQNKQRVTDLLARLREAGISTKLSTSFDFHGRKNSLWTEEIYLSNLKEFKDLIYTVGFVLTKKSIEYLLTTRDPLFEYLYFNYPLYFDYYVPENGAKYLMPSDQELLDAYLFIADNYPNISPVRDLLDNKENKMTCYSLSKITVLPDGKEVTCRYLKYSENDFNQPVDYTSNENIIESFLTENDCFSCEYFQRCSFRCFVQADWKKRQRTPSCLFKTFFKKIELPNGIDHKAD